MTPREQEGEALLCAMRARILSWAARAHEENEYSEAADVLEEFTDRLEAILRSVPRDAGEPDAERGLPPQRERDAVDWAASRAVFEAHAKPADAERTGDAEAPGVEWRPISEAPRDGTPILVWDPTRPLRHFGTDDDLRYAVAHWRTEGHGWANRNSAHSSPTHWMPLPPAPSATEPE